MMVIYGLKSLSFLDTISYCLRMGFPCNYQPTGILNTAAIHFLAYIRTIDLIFGELFVTGSIESNSDLSIEIIELIGSTSANKKQVIVILNQRRIEPEAKAHGLYSLQND